MKELGRSLARQAALAHRGLVLLRLIVRAAWLYARSWLASRGIAQIPREEVERRYGSFARDFVGAATRFRGGLIKLGQVASLRIDVLPTSVTEPLATLQDRVEPHPFEEIEQQLRSELGDDWRRHFGHFDREPIASASLGQVHRADTPEGEPLAVKVLYPRIEASVAVDLAMSHLALWLFDWIVLPDLRQVYRQLRTSLLGEMDYVREGRAAERIGANLESEPRLAAQIRIPRVHWPATRRRVLCMEYVEGDKINDLERLAARGVDMNHIVKVATQAFLHMMLRDGDFHCDPHPGNLMVDAEGRVVIVDFGMNTQLQPGTLEGMRDHIVAVVSRDRVGFASSLVALDMIDARDQAVVEGLADVAFDPRHYNLTPQEMMQIDFVDYFGEVRAHLGQIRGFRIPDGLVMWGRSLSLLYGLVSELAPGLRPLDVVGPYVSRFMLAGASGGKGAAARKAKDSESGSNTPSGVAVSGR